MADLYAEFISELHRTRRPREDGQLESFLVFLPGKREVWTQERAVCCSMRDAEIVVASFLRFSISEQCCCIMEDAVQVPRSLAP